MTVSVIPLIQNPMAKHGKRWTEAEMREFIGMWLAHTEAAEIGRYFGVTVRSVYKLVQRLRNNGVPLPPGKRGHVPERCNRPWTQSEVEYVVRRRNERATASQIAVELDRTHGGVTGLIARLREEGIQVRMLGQGTHRLWNAEELRAAIAGRNLRVVADESEEAA